jgi:hypothetical protein
MAKDLKIMQEKRDYHSPFYVNFAEQKADSAMWKERYSLVTMHKLHSVKNKPGHGLQYGFGDSRKEQFLKRKHFEDRRAIRLWREAYQESDTITLATRERDGNTHVLMKRATAGICSYAMGGRDFHSSTGGARAIPLHHYLHSIPSKVHPSNPHSDTWNFKAWKKAKNTDEHLFGSSPFKFINGPMSNAFQSKCNMMRRKRMKRTETRPAVEDICTFHAANYGVRFADYA